MLIQIIIILVLLLILLIAGIVIYVKISTKIKRVSTELFGTSDVTEVATQLKQEQATTPKSVSGMTTLLLPKITSDFPDFEYNQMKVRAENVLTSYLMAINNNSISDFKNENDELTKKLERYIIMLGGEGVREHFEQIHIHRTEIYQYRKTEGKCIITFQTALECYHYVTDSTDEVIKGEKQYKYQTKYNIDMIYIQDREKLKNESDSALGLNCPNCGAPISSLGAKHCAYCGTAIIEINIHSWSFSNITEIK
ncbi:MAG: zinc ribbon domain-containing protein [Lachnospiraceae bacterium]